MKIEMKNIAKSFGDNQVLKNVSFTIESGKVHSLMGENGAGKSTMMNILTGLLSYDDGHILIDGKETKFSSIKESEQTGITFIHQEMNNFADMSVLDNLFINKEIKKFGYILDNKKMESEAQHILNELDMHVNLYASINSLTVGQQQMLEIAKALMSNSKFIIMDEPTAALTKNEINKLFKIINKLKKNNIGIIYISHRMEELFEIADEVTIMRDGNTISHYLMENVSMSQIVHDMVGRDLGDFYPKRNPHLGDAVLKVDGLTGKKFSDITFEVKSGEILAFSGLMGSGRTEIMRAIFGIDPLTSGKIEINGEKATIKKPSDAINYHLGFLTEDRKTEGLILLDTVENNIILSSLDNLTKFGFLDKNVIDDFTNMLIKRLKIKTSSNNEFVGNLSGGNQQKVVLAKWIGSGSNILILDEPTRGVDVGAKRQIYDLMNELTDRGVAIIMISSDMDEVLGFSDRIAVIYEGKLQNIINNKDATQEKLMTLATGGTLNE